MYYLKVITMITFVTITGSIHCVKADAMNDSRQIITLPYDVKHKILYNMRDHINALDELVISIGDGEYDQAKEIAKTRLGWSSLVRQANPNQESTDHWTAPMQRMENAMFTAASDFILEVQNASQKYDEDSLKRVISSLQKVTNACKSCHQTYRLR